MALTQGILKLTVLMDRSALSTPIFYFTDKTDYTGNSVTLANVKGALGIYVDGDEYYDNTANIATTPDINGSSSGQTNTDLQRNRTKTSPILLPTNEDGSIKNGEYKFIYKVTDGVTTVTNEITMQVAFTKPEGYLTYDVSQDLLAPYIEVTDETSYVVDNVTPTKTRVLTLYFPADVDASPVSTSNEILEVTTFYTGEQVARLATDCSWDFSDKIDTTATNDWTTDYFVLNVEDTITDRVAIPVETTQNMSNLYCCIKNYLDRYYRGSIADKQVMESSMGQISLLLNSISLAQSTGGSTVKINEWTEQIKALVNCSGDCDCDEGEPRLITSVSAGGLVLGNTITFVTSVLTSTYQNNVLINSVYSSTNQHFFVFADGLKVTGTYNATLGTFTPTTPWVAGMTIEIVILR